MKPLEIFSGEKSAISHLFEEMLSHHAVFLRSGLAALRCC